MIIHFSLYHFLAGAAQQIFKGVLDIPSRLDVILLQKHLNDVFYPSVICTLCTGFFSLAIEDGNDINKRPPMIYYFIIEDPLNLYLQKNFHKLAFIFRKIVFYIIMPVAGQLVPLLLLQKGQNQSLFPQRIIFPWTNIFLLFQLLYHALCF